MAARFFGLVFKGHEEIHDLAGFWSAVKDVAGLNEVGFAADPLVPGVD